MNNVCNWSELWNYRFNYIFSNYINYLHSDSIISNSIDYFIGIFNLAIDYLPKDVKQYNYSYLVYKNYNCFNDFSNPLNFKVDLLERNISEYIKYLILNDRNLDFIFEILFKYMDKCNMDILIARIIYPNYYFDALDLYNNNFESCDLIKTYVDSIKKIELYLREIINFISKYYKIKKISIF